MNATNKISSLLPLFFLFLISLSLLASSASAVTSCSSVSGTCDPHNICSGPGLAVYPHPTDCPPGEVCCIPASTTPSYSTVACNPSSGATQAPEWYCDNINSALSSIWSNWEPIVMIAVFFSFSIAGVIFMLGIALRNEKIRNFAVGELYEATATAIIVVAFMFIAATLFGIIPAVVTGPIDPYNFALSYISTNINTTQVTIANIYTVAMTDEFYGSITTQISVGGVANIGGQVVQSLFLGIYTLFIIPARAVLYLLGDGLLALQLQFYLIIFFMYTAIPVFLIPGIVLRSLFPVRNLGGIMIAISIAFYLVMPTLFSIAYYFTNSGLLQSLNAYTNQIVQNEYGTSSQTAAATPTGALVTAIQGIQSSMGSYWLAILFYPALIIAISYESIKIIAEFIGGATRTSGKLRAI